MPPIASARVFKINAFRLSFPMSPEFADPSTRAARKMRLERLSLQIRRGVCHSAPPGAAPLKHRCSTPSSPMSAPSFRPPRGGPVEA